MKECPVKGNRCLGKCEIWDEACKPCLIRELMFKKRLEGEQSTS